MIVKQISGGVDPAARYARELRALRLAARAEPAVAPVVLGADDESRLLVLERLERLRPGPDWAVRYAETLARLHSTTGADDADDADALPRWSGPTATDVEAFLRLGSALGLSGSATVRDELHGVLDRLAAPSQNALLHGDPCPGNDLHTVDGVRFVDFEQAALGNGLVELAYLRIAFPTCWSSLALSPGDLAAAESAYRTEWLVQTDDEVSGDLVDACLAWLIRGDALVECAHRGKLDYLAKVVDTDWEWGPPTARERLVHRLGVVAELADGNPNVNAAGSYCAALRTRMLDRWPDLGPLPSVRDHRVDLD